MEDGVQSSKRLNTTVNRFSLFLALPFVLLESFLSSSSLSLENQWEPVLAKYISILFISLEWLLYLLFFVLLEGFLFFSPSLSSSLPEQSDVYLLIILDRALSNCLNSLKTWTRSWGTDLYIWLYTHSNLIFEKPIFYVTQEMVLYFFSTR